MILVATIIFVLAVLVMACMFLSKFGQLQSRPNVRIKILQTEQHHGSLWLYFKQKFSWLMGKLWHFILEAKDLTPATTRSIHSQYEKVKNVLRVRIRSDENEPGWLPEVADLS